jgi:ligand-binding sensor protein
MDTKPVKETPENFLEKTAAESGLAVVVVDEKSSLSKANNNSICEILYASKEFAPLCTQDCGRAFQRATAAGKPVPYQCHAGLDCLAVPLKTEKPLVAIVGRTFTKAENYRQATERVISGDWSGFQPTRFFENALITGSTNSLERVAKELENAGERILEELSEPSVSAGGFQEPQEESDGHRTTTGGLPLKTAEPTRQVEEFHGRKKTTAPVKAAKTSEDSEEAPAWRSLCARFSARSLI